MAECIDREALIKAISEMPLPDVVAVVRCKDCKFGVRRDWQVYPVVECNCPSFSFGTICALSDFCSFGEARE